MKRRHAKFSRFFMQPIVVLLLLGLLACDSTKHRKRPHGYLRVGNISDFQQPETFLPDLRFIVRKDENGYAIMSTLCTHDLSALKQVSGETGYVWKSDFSASSYLADGKVLTGPAVADLPYYRLVLDQAKLGGVRDTLYVHIGQERPRDWRLQIN